MHETDYSFLTGLSSRGLTSREASERLQKEGYNELPADQQKSILKLVLEVISEPMILLLLGAAGIYSFLGDFSEASLLLMSVFVIIGITFYQEHKTEKALQTLKQLSSPRALVIRDGASLRIAGREVVREDLLILKEGDRIPADAILLDSLNLHVDESMLTGESVPVRKNIWKEPLLQGLASPPQRAGGANWIDSPHPGGEDLPYVFSGTLITQGQGIAKVIRTGLQTELGKIGKAIQKVLPPSSPLQIETSRWVKILAWSGLSLCVLTTLVYALLQKNLLQGILVGITMAMSMIPEEIPVVLTVFLALGAWRMSKQNVLTRNANAIETLGSTTVLCVDKTGTLTQNQMQIEGLWAQKQFLKVSSSLNEIPESFHELVEYSILASQRDPFDPMERSLKQLGENYLADTEHLHADWHLVREYPLSRELLALSHVWKSPEGHHHVIAAKGAPEAIIDLCHLSQKESDEITEVIRQMSEEGMRVLGVAKALFTPHELPPLQHDFDFEWVGLIGFQDPVRPQVPQAMKECQEAGIRVIMITGDYPGTARHIAQKIHLENSSLLLTGPEVEAMSFEILRQKIQDTQIFARMMPEQKLKLVEALKANGEVVAMTGDGVNDAPALKSAHIGIAMGERGTDVAREASSLVLTDDNFASIVKAIRMGRRIYRNIQKAILYILSVHIPIAGLSFFPVLLGWPLLLLPMHIVFLELIIDPASSIVFEAMPEEKNIMKKAPRLKGEKLLSKSSLLKSIGYGMIVLFSALTVYIVALRSFQEEISRGLAFSTLIGANVALIIGHFSLSSLQDLFSEKLKSFWVMLIMAIVFLALTLFVPSLRTLFHFGQAPWTWLLGSFGLGLLCLLPLFFLSKINHLIHFSTKKT